MNRTLDAQIAEQVMGLCLHDLESRPSAYMQDPEKKGPYDWTMYQCRKCGKRFLDSSTTHPRCYSDDIRCAWEVVEKLKTDGWNVSVCGDNGWGCTFYKISVQGDGQFMATWEESHGPINAPTPAEAICLAALKVVTPIV